MQQSNHANAIGINPLQKIDKNTFDVALIDGARASLQQVYRELRDAEEVFYAGDAGGASNTADEYLPERGCPMCEASEALPFLTSRGLRIVRCDSCGHVYSRNIYTRELEARMYNSAGVSMWPAYLKMKEHPVLTKIERRRNIFYLEACERYVGIGRILDIGSGNGSLLYQAAERGWAVQGLDPNPVWQDIAPTLGVKPRLGTFPDDLPPGEQFDVIAMLDVLEHMADPVGFLSSTLRYLTPDGMVFVQVPNLNSLLLRLEGAANNNFCPGHWSYFDAESLTRLAGMCGFETLWIETVISELDRVLTFSPAQILATANILTQGSFQDIAELTPERMHAHLLGYKLICILRPTARI